MHRITERRLQKVDRENLENRHYKSTSLVTLQSGFAPEQNKELLLTLYDQVCSTWKALIDVRFKLLGLVPTVSIALLATILSIKSDGLTFSGKLLISILGTLSSIGLFIYDKRNSELHDDLISRGRKIEEELGIETGIFRGRLKPSGIIKHDVATNLVYFSTLIAWIAAIIIILIIAR
jgi:hypothetical protein